MTTSLSMAGAVALGGAVGALLRWQTNTLTLSVFGAGFPWGTLIVNVVGSFGLGLLIGALERGWDPSPELATGLRIGLFGALTTFSTFSLDVLVLGERGQTIAMSAYVIASVALSIAAAFVGIVLARGAGS